MSRGTKNKTKNHLQPITVVASRPPEPTPHPQPEAQPSAGGDVPKTVEAANPAAPAPPDPKSGVIKPVAVLAMGDAGEILAARDACLAIFGWDPTELVGRNVRVLLKDGLDNEVGRFLHRHRAGMNPAGTIEMNVTALRKDGREFPAHITTLTWNWGTTASANGDGDSTRLCWTAGFRDCSDEIKADASKPELTKDATATVAKSAKEARETSKGKSANLAAPITGPMLVPAKPAPVAPVPQAAPIAAVSAPSVDPASAVAQQRIGELEAELSKVGAELAGLKSEREKLGCSESELRVQLDTAKEAVGHAEAALQEEKSRREKLEERLQNLSSQLRLEQAERSQRFEEELVGLRKERDELNNRLSTERQSASESTQRAQDLETALGRNAADFAHVKAELERQAAERERSESSWREQLDTAWVAKKELEGAWAGAVEQNKRFEEELAKLRREHDELSQKLADEQKVAAESTERAKEVESRLSRNAADSDRARSELEKENAERKRADGDWRQQLEAEKALKAQLEASLAEAVEKVTRLEENLTTLRLERDDLQSRVKAEQQSAEEAIQRADQLQRQAQEHAAEVERLSADLAKQTAERQEAEARAVQLEDSAHDRNKKLEADWTAAVERNMRFEDELVKARQDYDELSEKLAAEKQVSAESSQAQSELESERADRKQAEGQLLEELNLLNSQKNHLEAALADAATRADSVEQELATLRAERERLETQVRIEQQAAEDFSRRAEEFQRSMDQHAAEMAQAAAEQKRHDAERQQAEAKAAEDQEAKRAQSRKLEAEWTAAVARNVQFEEELMELRKQRDELALQVKAEKRAAVDASHQTVELQRRLERNAADLERLTAEAGKKRSERDRAESEKREQLEAAQALARKLDAAWTAATERSRRFEGEVSGLRHERAELQGKLAAAQREIAHFKALAAQREKQATTTASSAVPSNGIKEKVDQNRNGSQPGEANSAPNQVRRDGPFSNGHRKPPIEPAAASSGRNGNGNGEGAIRPATNGNGHEPKLTSLESPAASRNSGDLQQYNFSEPAAVPAQGDTSLTKKRLQP